MALMADQARLTVNATTIVGPETGDSDSGGLIRIAPSTLSHPLVVSGTLIRGRCQLAAAGQVAASFTIESPGDSCGIGAGGGNQAGVPESAVALAPLAWLGDPTPVRVPLADSLLIDFVPMDGCILPDQRGQVPADGGCDGGAVELSALALDPVFADGFQSK